MFSVKQKQYIASEISKLLHGLNHPEMVPNIEDIQFTLHVDGAEEWSWADIQNNSAVDNPSVNPWNEVANDLMRNKQPAVPFPVFTQELLNEFVEPVE